MNKESIIAIILGLVLGILVAGGVVYFSVRQQRIQNTELTHSASADARLTPVVIPPTVVIMRALDITAPQSGSVTDAREVKIEGSAAAKSLLILQSPVAVVSHKLDGSTFSYSFPLALGENTIQVSSYPESSSVPVQKTIYIYRVIQ
ncbi:MAG: hypothetical protein WCO78_00585 [Candidatus Roizmanbacteria bacterium]